jgi:hypothetical protein
METAAQKTAASGEPPCAPALRRPLLSFFFGVIWFNGVAGGSRRAGGGDGGHLCHLCGYKYASAHPSAKHRRAHKKNCGAGGGGGAKSPPAAAAAASTAEEERQGKKLLLGDAWFQHLLSISGWLLRPLCSWPDAFAYLSST